MGDIVKIQTFTGTVEKIGLRSTRIRLIKKHSLPCRTNKWWIAFSTIFPCVHNEKANYD
ncbi:MAG: mechanosensitive ion channel domain-containing protein [Chitinophagaceae bacterium]